MDPTLTVLLFSSLAAASATLGAIPLALRDRAPVRWIGWANAMAGGLMLGAAYALSDTGLERAPVQSALGALAGILFSAWTHRVSGTEELDLNRLDETDPVYGYKVLLVNTLHSASEGVAIGIAMVASLPFGIFVALAIAVHNIPEGTILCEVLRSGGVRLREAASLAVATNVSQILLAVVTFAVVSAAPGLLPAVLGFAIGALVYLVLVELLPESYRQAGPTTIAIVTTVAIGMLVLLHGVLS